MTSVAFAAFAAAALGAACVAPLVGSAQQSAQAAEVSPAALYARTVADAQSFTTVGSSETLDRGNANYTVYVTPKPVPTPEPTSAAASTTTGTAASTASSSSWTPAFVSPDPGSAQAIGYQLVKARGWGDDQFACLVALWNRESGWRVNAYNSSGAYGIPQALPGSKMASVGSDWETNPATQITWGLNYIQGRYGNPCGAWAHSQATNWY